MARPSRVLLISSGGGHWVQLNRVAPAFENAERHFVTVRSEYRDGLGLADRFHLIPDATRWNRLRLVWCMVRVAAIILRIRPDVVVSTGAAPGFFGVMLGRRLGARTCWIDSIANTETLSMSGDRARRHADLVLTQWEHLECDDGAPGCCPVEFAGKVM